MGAAASRRQRALCHPDRVYAAYEHAYDEAKQHIKEKPPALRESNKVSQMVTLVKEHAFPWTWKTLTLLAMGSLPSNNKFQQDYKPRKDVLFDAAPELLQPETPAHLRVIPGAGGPGGTQGAPYKSRVAR